MISLPSDAEIAANAAVVDARRVFDDAMLAAREAAEADESTEALEAAAAVAFLHYVAAKGRVERVDP